MPCTCEGYSEMRGMDVPELWKSFSRHHLVLEKETEVLRERCEFLEKEIRSIRKIFPTMIIPEGPKKLPETPDWSGMTYRDSKGKFPSDISAHLDWLSEEDYKKEK